MSKHDAFLEDFLEHKYDPIKAREYYLRTRKLKGRATAKDRAKAKEYVTRTTADAQSKLSADVKKNGVKKNPARRIGAAEQKLIRARSLAERIKDPVLKAEMLAKISAAEKKVGAVKAKQPKTAPKAPAKKASTKVASVAPGSKVAYNGKPVKIKPGARMEEDETPNTSPSGAKLKDFDGKGLGKAVYADGSVFTSSGWQTPRKAPAQKAPAKKAPAKSVKSKKPVLRRSAPGGV